MRRSHLLLLAGLAAALACAGCRGATEPPEPRVVVLFQIPSFHEPTEEWAGGLTWDGTGFWTRIGDSICKLSLSGQILSRFPFQTSSGIEWDGSHLWIAAADTIYRVTPESGQVVRSFPDPMAGLQMREIVWDGSSLWVYGILAASPTWCRVSPSGELLGSLPTLSKGNYGAAWDGRRLCCITHPSRDVVGYTYSDIYGVTSTGEIVDARQVRGPLFHGLAFDGHSFYGVAPAEGSRSRMCRIDL